jgi:anti-sigma28 factor (negative regulator of flagellin synthesis)
MKVQSPDSSIVGRVRQREASQPTNSDKGVQYVAEDRANLSSLSKLLAGARENAFAIDTTKVNSLRDALQSGSFEIKPEQLVANMLAEEA